MPADLSSKALPTADPDIGDSGHVDDHARIADILTVLKAGGFVTATEHTAIMGALGAKADTANVVLKNATAAIDVSGYDSSGNGTLVIRDSNGVDVLTIPNIVGKVLNNSPADPTAPAVTADADVDSASVGATFTITATPTPTSGRTIAQVSFLWGDGSAVTVDSASPFIGTHSWATPGTKTVVVSATDSSGAVGTTSVVITVTPSTTDEDFEDYTFVDSFDRATGLVGNGWTDQKGYGYKINNDGTVTHDGPLFSGAPLTRSAGTKPTLTRLKDSGGTALIFRGKMIGGVFDYLEWKGNSVLHVRADGSLQGYAVYVGGPPIEGYTVEEKPDGSFVLYGYQGGAWATISGEFSPAFAVNTDGAIVGMSISGGSGENFLPADGAIGYKA